MTTCSVVATAKDPLEVGLEGRSLNPFTGVISLTMPLVTNETGPTRLLGTPVALKQK